MKKKWSKKRKIKFLIKTVFNLTLVLGLLCLFAFVINRFSLEIEPVDGNAAIIEAGSEYSDKGAKATLKGTLFFKDGKEIEVKTKGEVESTPGDYTITYSASFLWYRASEIRKVTVQDNTPPNITLKGDYYIYLNHNEPYIEPGYTAYDSFDGDITRNVEIVAQEDSITYQVCDSSGNSCSTTRTIIRTDSMPPALSLEGEREITIMAGEEYSEPGFKALDDADGNITKKVKVTGKVDPCKPGTYTLTYRAEDSFGNATELVRKVTVKAQKQKEDQDTGKYIYLTFDDGPSEHTPKLLKILKKYNVKATFFVIDSGYTEYISDIVKGGHSIGVHSATHDFEKIYSSEEAFYNDINAMQSIIEENGGKRTKLLRFPGGSSNTVSSFNDGIMTRLVKSVEKNGYAYFDWNVDSNDAGGSTTYKAVFKNVTEGIKGKENAVVLQHDTHLYSVNAVERIINWGLANGYTFKALNETSPNAHHGINN